MAFPKTNLAPALPIESMEQRIFGLGFTPRDVSFLFEHTKFPGIPFKSNSFCHFEKYATEVLHYPITTKDLSILF
jgi:hypothetical protein